MIESLRKINKEKEDKIPSHAELRNIPQDAFNELCEREYQTLLDEVSKRIVDGWKNNKSHVSIKWDQYHPLVRKRLEKFLKDEKGYECVEDNYETKGYDSYQSIKITL